MANKSNSGVLTTGQVARICKVAPRTVSKWFDRGQLQGYKIPGSRDRRIPVRQLLSFMKEHGMPTDAVETGPELTLIVANPGSRGDQLLAALSGHMDVMRAESLFEAGCIIERSRPHTVVIDLSDFGPQLASCITAIKANSNSARIVTVGGNGTLPHSQTEGMADAHVDNIHDTSALLSAITQTNTAPINRAITSPAEMTVDTVGA